MQTLLDSFGLAGINFNNNWIRASYNKIANTMTYEKEKYRYTFYDVITNTKSCYLYIKKIATNSGYNNIELCEYEGKKIIIRSTKKKDIESLLDSFAENIKTIYLYCWQKHNYPEFKIFPDIYAFGYNIHERKYYLVQEYISDIYTNDLTIKLPYIYEHLDQIKFRHGDLTKFNILMQEGNPILIDFGFSSFCINDIWFICDDILNYHYKYPDILTCQNNIYNYMHDLVLLINSIQLQKEELPGIMILDNFIPGNIIQSFIKLFSDIIIDDIKTGHINLINMLYFDESNCLDLTKHLSIFFYVSPKIYKVLLL